MTKSMAANGQQYGNNEIQLIYLDFDGELTSYNGEELYLDAVVVENSNLSGQRIESIVSALNIQYASQKVLFVTEKPAEGDFSTIYVGKSEAFSAYGHFDGLAETVDIGNENKSDKAFVLLDAENTDADIISVISHEADHLLGELSHGTSGLQAYAAQSIVDNGKTVTGLEIAAGDHATVYYGGTLNEAVVHGSGFLDIFNGGCANKTTVNAMGSMTVLQGGLASDTNVAGGVLRISSGGSASC